MISTPTGVQQLSRAQVVAAAECTDFQTAPSGIQFCDVREGTGKKPEKGSLIRQVAPAAVSGRPLSLVRSLLIFMYGAFSADVIIVDV